MSKWKLQYFRCEKNSFLTTKLPKLFRCTLCELGCALYGFIIATSSLDRVDLSNRPLKPSPFITEIRKMHESCLQMELNMGVPSTIWFNNMRSAQVHVDLAGWYSQVHIDLALTLGSIWIFVNWVHVIRFYVWQFRHLDNFCSSCLLLFFLSLSVMGNLVPVQPSSKNPNGLLNIFNVQLTSVAYLPRLSKNGPCGWNIAKIQLI